MHATVRAALATALLFAPLSAHAQLPSVEQIYDRFAEAVGGRDAWRPVQGRTEIGTADVTFAGIGGTYTRHWALPNKTRLVIDLGVVTIDNGFDGTQGWEAQGGPPQRMASAQEAELSEVHPDGAHFLDPARYAKAEVVGRELFAGSEAYKVQLTAKSGQESTEYFDVASGLRVGTVNTTPAGEVRLVYGDYKAFDGLKVPTRIVQNSGQGDVVLAISSVTFGEPDASVFKSPLSGAR